MTLGSTRPARMGSTSFTDGRFYSRRWLVIQFPFHLIIWPHMAPQHQMSILSTLPDCFRVLRLSFSGFWSGTANESAIAIRKSRILFSWLRCDSNNVVRTMDDEQ
jgi:hypothetical protein